MQQNEHVTDSVLGIVARTAMILETNNLPGGPSPLNHHNLH